MAGEEICKLNKVVLRLVHEVDVKNKQLIELKHKYNGVNSAHAQAMEEKDKLHGAYVEEMGKMQSIVHHYSLHNGKLKVELESLKKELEHQKEEAERIQVQLDFEPMEVENKIEEVKGTTIVKSHQIIGVDDLDHHDTAESYDQETVNALISKERASNSELQDARKALIKGLEDLYCHHRSSVWLKRIGELNTKPFRVACLQRFTNGEADIKAAELCSLWQEKIKDSRWHPFKIVTIDGKPQEIIKDDDENLKSLRNDWGQDVYDAVTMSLLEVLEHNPSGGYACSELWSYKENRKASLKEVIEYLLKQVKTLKASKRRKQQLG